MSGYVKVRNPKVRKRLGRKRAIRKRISGTAARPRLSVFRSSKHIYVQAIDDDTGRTLAAASSLDKELDLTDKKKAEKAKAVGEAVGKKLIAQNVESVVFDRNGFIYHGRVKEVAEGAREAGLKF
jgi:large subunit ribosomal protein L18